MTSINRRELLQRVAYLMGGAISAPAMLGVLQGCSTDSTSGSKRVFLTDPQAEIVTELAEIMIPRTDTPGAKDVGVPAFIDVMLKEAYPEAEQQRFITGLNELEALAQRDHQRPFLRLDQDHRTALVQRVHDEAIVMARNRPPETRPFILMMKELTLLGYFTSEVGARTVLQYDAVPGAYRGCVPLAQAGNGKAWAIDALQRF